MSQRIPLSPELRHALDQSAGGPVFLVDAANGDEVVMLRAAAYELLSRGLDISETYAAQDRALAAVWDDPQLDDYNDDGVKTA